MKKILAALLAVIAICSVSRADDIPNQTVVYRGVQTVRENNVRPKNSSYYYIFALTGSDAGQYQRIVFGSPTNKFFSVDTTVYPFTAFPAKERGQQTQTDFIYSITTTSTATPEVTVNIGDFRGRSISQGNLGGSFGSGGVVADLLTLDGRDASGNGDVSTDQVQLISGVFHLARNVTKQCNDDNTSAGASLSEAVGIVVAELEKEGYKPE